MSSKLGLVLFFVSALVTFANLQAQEPADQDSSCVHIKIKGPDEMVLILPFLMTDVVQKDLNLSDEQKEKIVAIDNERKARNRKIDADSKNLSAAEIAERNMHLGIKEVQKAWEKDAAETRKRLDEILLPGQFDRVQKIKFQQMSFAVFEFSEINEILEMTDEQKTKIKTIREDYWKELLGSRKVMDYYASRDEFRRESLESFEQEQVVKKKACEKVFEILTKNQIEKFNAIMGKKIDIPKLNEQFLDGILAEYPR